MTHSSFGDLVPERTTSSPAKLLRNSEHNSTLQSEILVEFNYGDSKMEVQDGEGQIEGHGLGGSISGPKYDGIFFEQKHKNITLHDNQLAGGGEGVKFNIKSCLPEKSKATFFPKYCYCDWH